MTLSVASKQVKKGAFATTAIVAAIVAILGPFLDPIERHFGIEIGEDELDHMITAMLGIGGLGAGYGAFKHVNTRKAEERRLKTDVKLARNGGEPARRHYGSREGPEFAPSSGVRTGKPRPPEQSAPPSPPEHLAAPPYPPPTATPTVPPSIPPEPAAEVNSDFETAPPPWMKDCGIVDINYGSDPKEGNVLYGDDKCLWVKAKQMDDYISGMLTNEAGRKVQVEMASREGNNPNNPWPDTLRFELLTKVAGPAARHRNTYHHFRPGKYTLEIQVDSKRQTDQFTLVPFSRPHSQKGGRV